jgi:hypothetical protein
MAMNDQQAIERYRYLLATAPPEDIERAHAEAFARLTPGQRRQILDGFARELPASEIQGDDPASLARTATRAELRQPGTIERVASGPGLGGMFLSTLAGAFIGTAIAGAFFGDYGQPVDAGDQSVDAGQAQEGYGETADAGGGDFGSDFGGGDLGDFGGGDFGDFGGI